MRLIVHGGFHKTGTSSVQQMLVHNRALLKQEFRLILPPDIRAATEAARAYSIAQDPIELGLFTYELANLFSTMDHGDPRPTLICAEDLAGHMQGRHNDTLYASAPELMGTFVTTAIECIPAAQIEFYFSTRAVPAWIKSCYAQHLRASRMCDTLEIYQARMLPHTEFATLMIKLRTAVAPWSVSTALLEDTSTRALGPLAPLLDVMTPSKNLRDKLSPMPATNQSLPKDLLEQFLVLNQSPRSDADVSKAKKALLHANGLS